VGLPTYPFERQRYWIDREQAAGVGPSGGDAQVASSEVGEQFYVPSWKRTLPAGAEAAARDLKVTEAVLVFDDGLIGPRLISRLKEKGFSPCRVVEGERFAREGDDAYTLTPGEREHYLRLMRELAERGRLPRQVIHLWGLDAEADGAPHASTSFEGRQRRELYSLLYLVHALSEFEGEVEVQYVVSWADDVIGSEVLRPEKSAAAGLLRVVPHEYPSIVSRLIDVDPGGAQPERLASQLASELAAGAAEASVAYRGPHRWVQTFEPLALREAPAGSGRLRQNGVYLVAGLGGEVELELAEYLMRAAKASVALVTPTALPPREQWGRAKGAAADTRLASALKRLADAEARGGRLLTVVADLRDAGEMGRALKEIERQVGSPHGAVYAGGYTARGPRLAIGETGVDEFARYFQTSVRGLHALEQALEGRSLDFCLLLSSDVALLGESGAAAYAAAAAYLEAVVRRWNRDGAGLWSCVNLGEGGGVGGPRATQATFGRLFDREMTGQVLVSARRPGGQVGGGPRKQTEAAEQPSPEAAAAPSHRRPNIGSEYVEPRNEVEQTVAAVFREFLGFERVGVNDDLFELGGDSLMATRLVSRVQQLFRVDVALGRFFEHPTVAGVALLVAEQQLELVDEGTLAGLMGDLGRLSEEEMRSMLEAEPEQGTR
jgi:acyl transferase domain-containing protein